MLHSKGTILIMPPFKRGDFQFTDAQNDESYEVARLRIHVERAIQRMKIFNVLKFFPHYLLPEADMIIRIIAFLANNFDDLIKKGRAGAEDLDQSDVNGGDVTAGSVDNSLSADVTADITAGSVDDSPSADVTAHSMDTDGTN